MSNIIDTYLTLVQSFTTFYRGCTIIKTEDGRYSVLRSSFATVEEAKQAIDAAFENMKKPI